MELVLRNVAHPHDSAFQMPIAESGHRFRSCDLAWVIVQPCSSYQACPTRTCGRCRRAPKCGPSSASRSLRIQVLDRGGAEMHAFERLRAAAHIGVLARCPRLSRKFEAGWQLSPSDLRSTKCAPPARFLPWVRQASDTSVRSPGADSSIASEDRSRSMRTEILASAVVLAGVLAQPTPVSAQADSPEIHFRAAHGGSSTWGWLGLLGLAGLFGLRRPEPIDISPWIVS